MSVRRGFAGFLASPLEAARRRLGGLVVRGGLEGLARAARLHPRSRALLRDFDIERDVPYAEAGHGSHRLDVYRARGAVGVRPALLYVHGGGFRICSKETHWLMAASFARAGYVVFNVDYRLSPRHRFPAAIEDVCAAARFVHGNAARFGADAERLVFAGESAGANLVTALAVATAYRRPEPFAAAVFDAGVRARAVAAACGIFQVSDPDRFTRRRALPPWLFDRILETCAGYLPAAAARAGAQAGTFALADPVCFFEGAPEPERPLPSFFLPVGTRDPLLDDTRRMRDALGRLGAHVDARFYVGGVHAFHAFPWDPLARAAWRDQLAFLEGALAR